jgi:HPr kinase/phosphorylase
MSPPAIGAERVHGTALALGDKAALIRGPSGSGKSDLALRCMTAPPLPWSNQRVELVADDQVMLTLRDAGIEVGVPPAITGKLEVRGLGILTFPHRTSARLALVVDLAAPADVPRYPLDPEVAVMLGTEVPLIRLAPFESAAAVKLILALEAARIVRTPQ